MDLNIFLLPCGVDHEPSGGCGFKSSGSNFENVVPGWDAQGEHGMRKLLFLIAVPALTLVLSAPSYAGAYHHGHYHPDYGGHARHSHRDWSDSAGRGHVHSVCWVHHHGERVWVCR
jgi:hypothetical protein